MKFVAAYLLAQLGAASAVGPTSLPGKGDVRRILESVGATVEDDRMDLLFAKVDGKDFTELIAAGRERLAYAPCAVVAMAGVASATYVAGALEVKEEEKKMEEKEEEEDDEGMGFSLFDD